MTRKLLVLVVAVFLANNAFGLQVAAVMWIMCVAFVLQLRYEPYQNETEQKLEKLSLGSITIACMAGQIILQARGEQGLGVAGLAFCRALIGVIITTTFMQFVVFFARELCGAARRKRDAASEREQASDSKSQTPPLSQHVGATDSAPFAVENPLRLQQERDGSNVAAAHTLAVAQEGRKRHESTETDKAQAPKQNAS